MTEALVVSLEVVGLATCLVLVVGVPVSIWLARGHGLWVRAVELIVTLPLVLPPTVAGWVLLQLLGRRSPLVTVLGIDLLFTLPGAAVAAFCVGLPLMVIAGRAAIARVDRRLEDVARTLGATEFEVLRDVTLPLARGGLGAGLLLAVIRAIGEFGATLMVGGSLPGRTRTLPIALYEAVQLGDDRTAICIVALLVASSVATLAVVRLLQREVGR